MSLKIKSVPFLCIYFALACSGLDLTYGSASAADNRPSPEATEETAPEEPGQEQPGQEEAEDDILSAMDKPQQVISSGLTDLVNYVDNYFFTEKVYYDATGSFIRLTGDMVWDEEAGDMGYTGNVRLKVNLRRIEDNLKLILETDPEEGRGDLDPELKDSPLVAAREADYYAGIQGERGDKEKWVYRLTIGAKVGSPLDYFARIRANRNYPLSEEWLLRLDEGIFWFDSFGTGVDTAVEFSHALSDDVLFRSRSYARWTNEDDHVDLSQVFSVFQSLDERSLMAYQAGIYGATRHTTSLVDYQLAVRYRRSIHKNYVFMEIVPQTVFRTEHDYHPDQSITFRLEVLFEG